MIRDEVYKFFADYIFQHSGMVYSSSEYYRLDARINELVKIFSLSSVEEVYEMYKRSITPDMKAVLINISTNNETYFFRDVKPFSVLTKLVLPEIIAKEPVGPISIWSAASSTGQEAFSMLMGVQSSAIANSFSRISVIGTDISTNALNKARSGTFNGLEVQRGLPIALLLKFFTQESEDTWRINQDIISKVKFGEFNLLKDSYAKNNYHIIFCRNVLIYQDKENKSAILNNLYSSLKPGGYLFLGSGESLIGIDTKFERVTLDGYTVYKK